MRHIQYIAIHCSAGFGSLESVRKYWREKLRWQNVGYHYFIDTDGTVHKLAQLAQVTNGVQGYNSNSVHICYQGGIDTAGKAKDTRTVAQKLAIESTVRTVLQELSLSQPVKGIQIKGHRDFSPDKNGNGIIESWERIKECPCFDAIPEYRHLQP